MYNARYRAKATSVAFKAAATSDPQEYAVSATQLHRRVSNIPLDFAGVAEFARLIRAKHSKRESPPGLQER